LKHAEKLAGFLINADLSNGLPVVVGSESSFTPWPSALAPTKEYT